MKNISFKGFGNKCFDFLKLLEIRQDVEIYVSSYHLQNFNMSVLL